MGLHATRITNNKWMLRVLYNIYFAMYSHAGRQFKTKNGSTSLNCTNNIKRFYNARLHAIFKANGANDSIWFAFFLYLLLYMLTHNVRCEHAMHCISLIFMWSLFMDGAVCSVLTAFVCIRLFPFKHFPDSNATHFPSSLIFIPYGYRYSVRALYCFSYINIFFYAARILKTLVTTIARPANWGVEYKNDENGKKGDKMP